VIRFEQLTQIMLEAIRSEKDCQLQKNK